MLATPSNESVSLSSSAPAGSIGLDATTASIKSCRSSGVPVSPSDTSDDAIDDDAPVVNVSSARLELIRSANIDVIALHVGRSDPGVGARW